MSSLQHHDIEREIEYADEGDPTPIVTQPLCPSCTDEYVAEEGQTCALCLSELVDQDAMRLLVTAAASVEIKCALTAIERAIKHIARGRYHLPRVVSRVIDVLTEAA